MWPDVRTISANKNNLTQPIGEVNNKISTQVYVWTDDIRVCKEILQSFRITKVFFKPGLLALTSCVMWSEDCFLLKKLGYDEL